MFKWLETLVENAKGVAGMVLSLRPYLAMLPGVGQKIDKVLTDFLDTAGEYGQQALNSGLDKAGVKRITAEQAAAGESGVVGFNSQQISAMITTMGNVLASDKVVDLAEGFINAQIKPYKEIAEKSGLDINGIVSAMQESFGPGVRHQHALDKYNEHRKQLHLQQGGSIEGFHAADFDALMRDANYQLQHREELQKLLNSNEIDLPNNLFKGVITVLGAVFALEPQLSPYFKGIYNTLEPVRQIWERNLHFSPEDASKLEHHALVSPDALLAHLKSDGKNKFQRLLWVEEDITNGKLKDANGNKLLPMELLRPHREEAIMSPDMVEHNTRYAAHRIVKDVKQALDKLAQTKPDAVEAFLDQTLYGFHQFAQNHGHLISPQQTREQYALQSFAVLHAMLPPEQQRTMLRLLDATKSDGSYVYPEGLRAEDLRSFTRDGKTPEALRPKAPQIPEHLTSLSAFYEQLTATGAEFLEKVSQQLRNTKLVETPEAEAIRATVGGLLGALQQQEPDAQRRQLLDFLTAVPDAHLNTALLEAVYGVLSDVGAEGTLPHYQRALVPLVNAEGDLPETLDVQAARASLTEALTPPPPAPEATPQQKRRMNLKSALQEIKAQEAATQVEG